MRFFFIPAALIILASCNNADRKPVEKKMESGHSQAFNQGFDAMMNDYYALTEAYVNWDSNAVNAKATALKNSLKSVALDDLRSDTSTYITAQESLKNTAATLDGMMSAGNITAKRHNFNNLTLNIYDLLRAVKYDGKKLYLQECPMAFNDTEAGVWLTDKGSDVIRNPYLGLHHPKYGKSMIECGSNKSTIDFQK